MDKNLEVHWFSGSAPSWRVLLTLELKQVPYTSRLINVSKGEHKAPGFLALNPRGRVPVLRDGGYVLAESLAIMAYLDRKFPEPSLFGRSAEETGRIWRAIMDFELGVTPLMLQVILPIFLGQTEEKADEVAAGGTRLHEELTTLEDAVSQRDWMAGGRVSAADISIYPFVEALLRAAAKPAAERFELGFIPFDRRFPALDAWRGRIRALPGYDNSYPPHWREAT